MSWNAAATKKERVLTLKQSMYEKKKVTKKRRARVDMKKKKGWIMEGGYRKGIIWLGWGRG